MATSSLLQSERPRRAVFIRGGVDLGDELFTVLQAGPPSLDSSQLVPLAEAAQRLLQHLAEHCENKPAASIHVVSRDKVSVEDKMARPALRALRSSIVDVDPTKLMQEAGQIWSSIMDVRMKSYHLIETCILVLG